MEGGQQSIAEMWNQQNPTTPKKDGREKTTEEPTTTTIEIEGSPEDRDRVEKGRTMEAKKERPENQNERSKNKKKKCEEAKMIIRRMITDIEEMDERVKACGNTKKDVKEASKKARANADKARKAGILETIQELMTALEERGTEKPRTNRDRAETKTTETQTIGRERQQKATQTETRQSEVTNREASNRNRDGPGEEDRDRKGLNAGAAIRQEKGSGEEPRQQAEDTATWQGVGRERKGDRRRKPERQEPAERRNNTSDDRRRRTPAREPREEILKDWPKPGERGGRTSVRQEEEHRIGNRREKQEKRGATGRKRTALGGRDPQEEQEG